MKFGLSQPMRRVEDPRLLRGEGRYTDDVSLPGQAWGVVVRSPHAHAAIRSIDKAPALGVKGDSAPLHLFRGRFRVDRQQCAGALEDFRAAEALAPADPAAPASAGMALLCLGRKEEAIASLRRSLELNPDQPPVAAYLARLERPGPG